MSYKVIHFFTDLQDFNHPYKVGDVFPRLGMVVSEKRLQELSTNQNKQRKPLIAKVNEQKDFVVDDKVVGQVKNDVIKENTLTKTDINRMSTAELRALATVNGIKNSDEITGGELKKLLINQFGL